MSFYQPQIYFRNQGYDSDWFENSKSHQIELLLINEKYDLHSNKYNRGECHAIISFLKKELRKSIKREKANKKKNKKGNGIIKIKKNTIQTHECIICLEIPDYNNLLITNCKHKFCKECYKKWEMTVIQINDSRVMSCPNCRKQNPKTFEYKILK